MIEELLELCYGTKFILFLKQYGCYESYFKNKNDDILGRIKHLTEERTYIMSAFDWGYTKEQHTFWELRDNEWKKSIKSSVT